MSFRFTFTSRNAKHGKDSAPLPRARRAGLVGGAVAALLATSVPLASPAQADLSSPCYTPVLRDVMISQGLPSYPLLARGKSTLAKFFFSLPNDATCSLSLHEVRFLSGTVTMTYNTGFVSTQTVSLPDSTLTPLTTYTSAAQADGKGDPTFLVPGNQLTPADLEASLATTPYPVRFSATLRYRARNPVTGEYADRTLAPVTTDEAGLLLERNVDRPANPLRVLVVPMGDGRDRYTSVFDSTAEGALHNAMTTLSRTLPVADGIGDLLSGTGGLRYSIAPSQKLIDLGPHDEDGSPDTLEKNYIGADGLYCGQTDHFTYIQSKLAEARTAWNSANPSTPAHRVLGVIAHEVSKGASTGTLGCIEGYAGISAPEAWSRLVLADGADKVQSAGGIASMELLHTLGNVPATRSSGAYHSPNTEADGTAVERGYNVAKKAYLPSDRSVMKFAYEGWTDDNVLAESADYQEAACVLTSGTGNDLTTTVCAAPGSVGAVAAGAVDATFLAGRTDGTPSGTRAHTYVAPHRGDERPPAASEYQVVYYNSGTVLRRTNLAVSFTHSEHDSHEHGEAVTTTAGTFDASYDAPPLTDRFDIVRTTSTGDVVLYSRSKNARPQIQAVRPASESGKPTAVAAQELTHEADPAISQDGRLLAHVTDTEVTLRRVTDPTQVAATMSRAEDPALSQDGNQLAFTRAGDLYVSSIALDPFGQLSLGTPRLVYDFNETAGGTNPAYSPTFSPDGSRVAFAMGEHIWAASTAPGADNYCGPAPAPTDCQQITLDDPDVLRQYVDPDWSAPRPGHPAGLLAATVIDYTDNDTGRYDVHVLDPEAKAAVIGTLTFAQKANWGSGKLFFYDDTQPVAGGPSAGLSSVDAETLAGRSPVPGLETTDSYISVAADDSTFAFERREPVANTVNEFTYSDVYLARATDSPRRVVMTDDKPEDLRLDVFAQCGAAQYPVLTGLYPEPGTGSDRTFTVEVDETGLCPDARLVYRGTDGFQFADPAQDEQTVTGRVRPVAAVVSPRQGETFSPADSVPLQVSGWDSTSRPLVTEYTVTGPGGTRTGQLAPGGRTDLPQLGVPGTYTVTARVAEPSGSVGESSSTFVVYPDADGDRIPTADDVDCTGTSVDNDARNSVTDSDGDVLVGDDDAFPCKSYFNAIMDVDANRINPVSQGSQLTVYVSGPSDLGMYALSEVAITRLGGQAVRIPALRWYQDGLTWTAKFDRQVVQAHAKQMGLTGYAPITVTGNRAGSYFAGADPSDPDFD